MSPHISMSRLSFRPNIICNICLEDIHKVTKGQVLTCCKATKVVHNHCLLTWFTKKMEQGTDVTCPFCRTTLLPYHSMLSFYKLNPSPHKRKLLQTQHEPLPVYADANFVYHAEADVLTATHHVARANSLTAHAAHGHIMQLTTTAYVFFVINICMVMWLLVRQSTQ